MTLLLCSFVVVEGKTRKSGEKSGRAGSDSDVPLGIAERALNDPRNHTSTNGDTSNMKNHNKK
jgi:hypothetical protein